MSLLFDVVTQVTIPIVALIAAGYVLTGRLSLDVRTLNRFFLYASFPAFLIVSLARADIPLRDVQVIVVVTIVQYFAMLALGLLVAHALKLPRPVALMVAVAAAFPNSGNYGIPLIEFAFGQYLVPQQAVITTLHLILILFTAPLLLSERRPTPRGVLRDLFQTPLIPAVLLGVALNVAGVTLPTLVARPLEVLGASYIPLALFILGAQMRDVRLGGVRVALGVAGLLRLAVAPAATWAALMLADLPGPTVAFLTVGATAPVGVLLPVLAVEYGRKGELSSAAVLVTTVLSPLAATAAVVLLRLSG